MLEVAEALEPDIIGSQNEVQGESGTAVQETFAAAQEATRKVLADASLEKLAAGSEPMYFI